MSNTINYSPSQNPTTQPQDTMGSASDLAHDEFVNEMNLGDVADQDDDDNDLFHGLGSGNQKDEDRRKSLQDQYQKYTARTDELSDQLNPKHAGDMLRLNLSQRALQRVIFEQHSRYVARLSSDGAADYFNALSGEHCYLLGVFAVAFAYSDKSVVNLEFSEDTKILENALFDGGLDANGRLHTGRPLPLLESFSNALGEASHNDRLVDSTLYELVEAFSSTGREESEYFAAIRLFEAGDYAARVLAPLINQSISNLAPSEDSRYDKRTANDRQAYGHQGFDSVNRVSVFATGGEQATASAYNAVDDYRRYPGLSAFVNRAIQTPTTACEVIASDAMSDENIKRLNQEPTVDFSRLLDAALSSANLSLNPTAVSLRAKASRRLSPSEIE